MLKPVREDTLAFHVNQLKWMGYPLVVLLLINLTCVLYAISQPTAVTEKKPSPEYEIARVSRPSRPRPAPNGLVLISPEQTIQLEQERSVADETGPEITGGLEDRVTTTSLPAMVPEQVEDEIRSIGESLVSLYDEAKEPVRWLSTASKRLASLEREKQVEIQAIQHGESESDADPAATVTESTPAMANPAEDQSGLMILNPISNGGSVTLLIDGDPVTLGPGEKQILSGNRQHAILFHRGGDFGNASHIVAEGEYHFAVTQQGWALVEFDD